MVLKRYLLIYPIGNSDLAFNGEETFPRNHSRDFQSHLTTLGKLLEKRDHGARPLELAGEPFPSGLDFTACPTLQRKTWRVQQEFIIESLRFPILFDILTDLFRQPLSARVGGELEVQIQPIVTDQSPPHPQDTVLAMPLLRVYSELLNRYWQELGVQFRVRVRSPWVLRCTVSDYDSLLRPYQEFYERVNSELEGFERIYFSLTTGTPAMSFAAGTIFATDPRITFIYKPRGAFTPKRVAVFRDRVRWGTLMRLRALLERFDFRGASEVVRAERSGFSFGEVETAFALLKALEAWQTYDFQRAAEIIQSRPSCGVPSLRPLRGLCERLSQDNPLPGARAQFWQVKVVDTLMRLEIAVWRGDLPDVLYQFYNYNDVCLAWGLSEHFPELDVHAPRESELVREVLDEFCRRCPGAGRALRNELGKFQLLYALFESDQHRLGEAFNGWFRVHQLLRWFQDRYVDGQRHRLVHGSVKLREEVFDDIFRNALNEWGGRGVQVGKGDGPWLLLGIVYRSFAQLPHAQSSDLVRATALAAWKQLASLVPETPDPPRWSDWPSTTPLSQLPLDALKAWLERGFAARAREMQAQYEQDVNQWKEEIRREIVQSDIPPKFKAELSRGAEGYAPLSLGPYLAHGFISLGAALENRAQRFERLAALHASFDFREDQSKKAALGQYLSGNIGFAELFFQLNPQVTPGSTARMGSKSDPRAGDRSPKRGSGPRRG